MGDSSGRSYGRGDMVLEKYLKQESCAGKKTKDNTDREKCQGKPSKTTQNIT
jgi:hypothetical protein